MMLSRHGEERSDAAIQLWIASRSILSDAAGGAEGLAMTTKVDFLHFRSILHCNTKRFSKRRERSRLQGPHQSTTLMGIIGDPARASTDLLPNSRGVLI
jgi:hypothetical protein